MSYEDDIEAAECELADEEAAHLDTLRLWEEGKTRIERLERINAALLAACKDLADRCDRARELLKHGQGGHWGMLDTASTREVIAAAETPNPKGE